MAFLVMVFKAWVEVALMLMAGRIALGVISGRQRERNGVYVLFGQALLPVLALARRLSPRNLSERTVALVAFLLLALVWVMLTAAKIHLLHAAVPHP